MYVTRPSACQLCKSFSGQQYCQIPVCSEVDPQQPYFKGGRLYHRGCQWKEVMPNYLADLCHALIISSRILLAACITLTIILAWARENKFYKWVCVWRERGGQWLTSWGHSSSTDKFLLSLVFVRMWRNSPVTHSHYMYSTAFATSLPFCLTNLPQWYQVQHEMQWALRPMKGQNFKSDPGQWSISSFWLSGYARNYFFRVI